MGEASDPGERTPDTASDVAPDAGRLKASRTPRPLHGGRYFFLGMGLLCLALGGVGLAMAAIAGVLSLVVIGFRFP